MKQNAGDSEKLAERRDLLDGDSQDGQFLHGVVRALLICREKKRLYPEGHEQVRRSVKDVLQVVQTYAEETKRAFHFISDSALDLGSKEKSTAANDLAALARLCRSRRIRSFAIESGVDCEELDRFLDLLAQEFDNDEELEAAAITEVEFELISVEFCAESDEDETYLFNDEGEQLFSASAASLANQASLSQATANLPPSIQQGLSRVFGDPAVKGVIDAVQTRMGPASSSGIDIVAEIVSALSADAESLVERPHEELAAKIGDFVRFLEELSRNAGTGQSTSQLSAEEVRELIRGSVGWNSWNQPGLPEIVARSARLQTLFGKKKTPEGGTAPARSGGPENLGLDDVDSLFPEIDGLDPDPETTPPNEDTTVDEGLGIDEDTGVGAPAIAREPTRDEGSALIATPQDESSIEDELGFTVEVESAPEPESSVVDFSNLLAVPINRPAITNHLESFDYRLESLRIEFELLLGSESLEGDQLAKFIESLNSQDFRSPERYLNELGSSVELLREVDESASLELLKEALASQTSQDVIDLFLKTRKEEGSTLETLRPVLYHIAESDPDRPLRSLTTLWQASPRSERPEIVSEIFARPLGPESLAIWGEQNPQAFTSPIALARLRRLPADTLHEMFSQLLGGSRKAKAGPSQAALATLRALAGKSEGENYLVKAIRDGEAKLRHEALCALQSCETKDLFAVLENIVERENEEKEPDLEAVRLSLTALLRSRLPHAKNLLRRIRHERKLVRHTFRTEIREILELLGQMEELTL
ncbi:MAG: hypothetical protein AAF517_04400 [Planctomycetota bacterium]